MTERMINAGVKAYIENAGNYPDALICVIWQAMADERQSEALEGYWKSYEEEYE